MKTRVTGWMAVCFCGAMMIVAAISTPETSHSAPPGSNDAAAASDFSPYVSKTGEIVAYRLSREVSASWDLGCRQEKE